MVGQPTLRDSAGDAGLQRNCRNWGAGFAERCAARGAKAAVLEIAGPRSARWRKAALRPTRQDGEDCGIAGFCGRRAVRHAQAGSVD